MTDSYNTPEFQDPQTKHVLKSINSTDKEKESKFPNYSKLYEDGLNHFNSTQFLIELNSSGDHCGHDIWIESDPIPVKGINYPSYFKPYRPIFSNEDFKALNAVYSFMPDNTKEFWEQIVFPKNKDNPLSQYSDRLNAMNKIKNRYTISDTFKYKHTHDRSDKGVFGKNSTHPKTWIPAKEWFQDNIRELTFDDIFCLLPPAERNIFKLWLGKIFAQVKTY